MVIGNVVTVVTVVIGNRGNCGSGGIIDNGCKSGSW